MPRLPQPGNCINGYTIARHINSGAMANAYEATAPDGARVFFKQYKSPSVAVSWFRAFAEHNQELNRRIGSPELQRFCVRNLASFESKFGVPTYFQVFEFVEGGHDLGTILKRAHAKPSTLSWEQRLIMAKVIMASIRQLHDKKVVHADLKPPNIQMIKDETIKVGYQPKLIDMDRSVLEDRRAPWHGHESYVGTPRYFSPEHFGGRVPERASDVFTCGIILYELLAQGPPFPAEDEDGYKFAVKRNAPPPPKLLGSLRDEASSKMLIETLQRCLCLDTARRPTALDVAHALNGRTTEVTAPVPVPEPRKEKRPPPTAPTPAPVEVKLRTLIISGPRGSVRLNVRTSLGRHLLRQVSEEAIHADPHQFSVEPRGGDWWIIPAADAHAQTTVNDTALEAPAMLKDSDIIALRGRKSGKSAMRITVQLS